MSEHYLLEIKRGFMVLTVLSQLDQPQYGYSLSKLLEDHNFVIETNTLYPLLRRLEKNGLLTSSWDTQETNPRKYYRRTKMGDDIYNDLVTYYQDLSKDLDKILKEK